MEEFFKQIIDKLRAISADGKDAGELRAMLTEFADELEVMTGESDAEPPTINEDEEAEFIQNRLLLQGAGVISTDDIKLVISSQTEYLVTVGLA